MGKRMVERHQHRMDALEQAFWPILRHADQADTEAQGRRLGNVGGDHMADAGGGDMVEVQFGAKGQAGKDGQLVRGIDAVNVEARIGLGIAQFLGFLQHLVKAPAFLFHGGQDVIAGAVEDAIDAADLVGGRAFAHALDDRNAAGDRRFIFERHARLLGAAGKVQAMMGQHRLVGGDERLAGGQALAGEGEGRAVGAADQFDHHVDIVAGRQRRHVVDPFIGRQVDAAILVAVARGDGDHLHRAAGAAGNQVAIGVEQANDAATHRSEANERDAQRGMAVEIGHGVSWSFAL